MDTVSNGITLRSRYEPLNGGRVGLFGFAGTIEATLNALFSGGFQGATGYTGYTGYTGPSGTISISGTNFGDYIYWNTYTSPASWQVGDLNVNIGGFAGMTGNSGRTVSVGYQSGETSQGTGAVAIGYQAGQTTQGTDSIAIGNGAGNTSQPPNSIIINASGSVLNGSTGGLYVNPVRFMPGVTGAFTFFNTSTNELFAGNIVVSDPNTNLKYSAGILSYTGTPSYSGLTLNENNIALGNGSSQSVNSVRIGYEAGNGSPTGTYGVAIGPFAGYQNQLQSAIAIGSSAGYQNQQPSATAVGNTAGTSAQGTGAVAIGNNSAANSQGQNAVAIGNSSGQMFQGENSVAIGNQAGYTGQGPQSISIGYQAGYYDQAGTSVAIGSFAGYTGQAANSIILSASGSAVNAATGGFFVAPIALNINGTTSGFTGCLQYNPTTAQVIYNTAKTFIIDHPTHPDKYLVHACIEGPEMGIYYRGEDQIRNGKCRIKLPAYTTKLGTDWTIQATYSCDFSEEIDLDLYKAIVVSKVKNGEFYVLGTDAPFNWTAYGKRGNIETEVLKTKANLAGNGPYTYLK
jgi:hypothetical protein